MLLCFIFISLFSKYVLKNKIRIKNELLFGNNLIKRRTYWHWNKQPVKNIKIILWVSCYFSTQHSSKKSKAELLWMNEWMNYRIIYEYSWYEIYLSTDFNSIYMCQPRYLCYCSLSFLSKTEKMQFKNNNNNLSTYTRIWKLY